MDKNNIEPLKIITSFIKFIPENEYFPHNDRYILEVQDQYGRWWIYYGAYALSLDEAEEIEAEELKKGVINLKLYYFDDNRIIDKIKRQEEIYSIYVRYRYTEYFDSSTGAQVMVMAGDDLEYVHDKIFYDYDKLKNFALKIKAKGIINLEFWTCIGSIDPESGSGSSLEELEDTPLYENTYDYRSNEHEWNSKDIYNSLGGEEGERKYMSDGAWISPDGTITFDR